MGRDFPVDSLRREGSAMIAALAEDFQRIPGVEVVALRDHRFGDFSLAGCELHEVHSHHEETQSLVKLATECDWTVLIAPEFDRLLLERSMLVEGAGGRLLGPSSRLIQWSSDKAAAAARLRAAGIPVPESCLVGRGAQPPPDFPFPAVLKPRDGAGSMGVRRLENARELAAADGFGDTMYLERFCPGTAASVALVGGPNGFVLMPPCRQHLSDDGQFTYLGGELLDEPELRGRAGSLARRVGDVLGETLGYLGIDMVLGKNSGGRADVVIEINPRMTTSYIGLRVAVRENLAQVMLDVAQGRSVDLSTTPHRVRFHSDGRVVIHGI